MQFKSSTVDTLKDLLEIQLPAEGSRLITYCADGAPELISRDIVRILSQHNCKIMYSPPYTMLLLNGIIGQLLNQAMPCYQRQIYQLFFGVTRSNTLCSYTTIYLPILRMDTSARYKRSTILYQTFRASVNLGVSATCTFLDYMRLQKICDRETREKGFIDKAELE